MQFCEKLAFLRRSKGMTQETLAERLNISRQAVAKWEAGQGFPDITNLILLSEVLLVTVDYLVKEDPCIRQPIPSDIDLSDDFVRFLLEAKRKTYAGKGAETASSRPSSHDLLYREGDYLYIDTFLGGEAFSGEEAVWLREVPIFSMNYVGRVIGDGFSGDFLKAALSHVPEAAPYRGPAFFHDGPYTYRCSASGSIDWFQGYEEIFRDDELIFECFYHGGRIR